MSISKSRRLLYQAARALGDYQAVKRGRIGQRVVNRAIGRGAARALRRLWR